jgi:hypothetical protein
MFSDAVLSALTADNKTGILVKPLQKVSYLQRECKKKLVTELSDIKMCGFYTFPDDGIYFRSGAN